MSVVEEEARPGEYLERVLPDGSLLTFEQRDTGYRAYHHWPVDEDGVCHSSKRVRLPSVTTVLGSIIPKDLVMWGEEAGIRGAWAAIYDYDAEWTAGPDGLVAYVRQNKLGAEAARQKAAGRGISVHKLLEDWMTSGTVPNPADHPNEHRGYIQALARWVVAVDPDPIEVEFLVCSPDDKYAGRVDLLARIDGRLTLVDLKTQKDAGIFSSAHVQVALYDRAIEKSSDYEVEQARIVVLAENGAPREMEAMYGDATALKALEWYDALKPIDSACRKHNKVEKDVRRG